MDVLGFSRQQVIEVAKAHKGFLLSLILGIVCWLLHVEDLIDQGEGLVLFASANLTIVAGYYFAAVAVGPRFRGVDMKTKVAGFWFFMCCGFTHTELTLHALFTKNGITLNDFLTFHMLVMHFVQAWAIWGFLFGLSRFFKDQEQRAATHPKRRYTDAPGRPGV